MQSFPPEDPARQARNFKQSIFVIVKMTYWRNTGVHLTNQVLPSKDSEGPATQAGKLTSRALLDKSSICNIHE